MRPLPCLLLAAIACGSCAYRITAEFEPGEFQEELQGTFRLIDDNVVWIHVGRNQDGTRDVTQVRFNRDGGTNVSPHVATRMEDLPILLLDPLDEGENDMWSGKHFVLRYRVDEEGLTYRILDPEVIDREVKAGNLSGTLVQRGDDRIVDAIDEDLNGWRRIASEDRFWGDELTAERVVSQDRDEPADED